MSFRACSSLCEVCVSRGTLKAWAPTRGLFLVCGGICLTAGKQYTCWLPLLSLPLSTTAGSFADCAARNSRSATSAHQTTAWCAAALPDIITSRRQLQPSTSESEPCQGRLRTERGRMRLLHQARSEVSALETSGGGRRGPEVGGGEGIATRAMAPSQKGSPNIGCKRLLQHPLMCSHTPAHFPAACSKNTKLAGGQA